MNLGRKQLEEIRDTGSDNLAKNLLDTHHFYLPEFSNWTVADWKRNKGKIETVRKTMLGWDITDYGMGDFKKVGSVLFTIRNGDLNDSNIGTPYAEKIIPIYEGQRLPMHFHSNKTEDIINRGGGVMYIKLYNTTDDDQPDMENDVQVYMDGILHVVKPDHSS